MLRAVFFIFALFSFAFCVENDADLEFLKSIRPTSAKEIQPKAYTESEILNKDHITIEDLKAIAPSEDASLNLDDSELYQDIRVTALLLSTQGVPKNIYENQIFSVDFLANIQQNVNLDLNLTMQKSESLEWLNSKNLSWDKDIRGVYRTKLWFIAHESSAKLESIKVVAKRNGEFFQSATISPKLPKILAIESEDRQNYANIVADELIVKGFKTSKFDDNSNIMTIELAVKGGNLNSLNIESPSVIRQGVNSIKGNYTSQSGYYFVVINKEISSFDFSYFNAKTKQFENYSLGVSLEFDDLSTQTDLNPQNDPFLLYKKFAMFLGVIVLIFMFIVSKNSTPLILASLLIALNIYLQDPHSTGIVRSDAMVKILPIESSTIFYSTSSDEKVEIFEKNRHYYKVLFENGKIGWVDEKNLKFD